MTQPCHFCRSVGNRISDLRYYCWRIFAREGRRSRKAEYIDDLAAVVDAHRQDDGTRITLDELKRKYDL